MDQFTGTPRLYDVIDAQRLSLELLKEALDIHGGVAPAPRLKGKPEPSEAHRRIAAETQELLAHGRFDEAIFQAGRSLTRFVPRPPAEQRAMRALYDALALACRDHQARALLADNEYGAQQLVSFVSRLARSVEKMSRSEA